MHELNEVDTEPDPLHQFSRWFREAQDAELPQPEAMSLATADSEGRPSARMVLLKGFDERGFVFYTNYQSRKGLELAVNPFAALVFYWHQLHRQVRVEGEVELAGDEESDRYFETRPRLSRFAAIASAQSRVIESRSELERRVEELQLEFGDDDPPRPAQWGSYRLRPTALEFWQGRPNRLHDRLRYLKSGDGWEIQRLSP